MCTIACCTGSTSYRTYDVSGCQVRPCNRGVTSLRRKGYGYYIMAMRGSTSPIGPPCPGGCRCDCRMGHQDCSAFRPFAEPSCTAVIVRQVCGEPPLCSMPCSLAGRMFVIRHVRSKSGEGVGVSHFGLFVGPQWLADVRRPYECWPVVRSCLYVALPPQYQG